MHFSHSDVTLPMLPFARSTSPFLPLTKTMGFTRYLLVVPQGAVGHTAWIQGTAVQRTTCHATRQTLDTNIQTQTSAIASSSEQRKWILLQNRQHSRKIVIKSTRSVVLISPSPHSSYFKHVPPFLFHTHPKPYPSSPSSQLKLSDLFMFT